MNDLLAYYEFIISTCTVLPSFLHDVGHNADVATLSSEQMLAQIMLTEQQRAV